MINSIIITQLMEAEMEVSATDINMTNCEEGAKFCVKFHHWAKGIIFQYLSNPGSSIIRRKKENNVGKVMYDNSCQFVTLLCLKNAREKSSRGRSLTILQGKPIWPLTRWAKGHVVGPKYPQNGR